MNCKQIVRWPAPASGLLLIATLLVAPATAAEPPSPEDVLKAVNEATRRPQMLGLPVRVVDEAGKPVANVKVTPWALRCSQGHGWWGKDDKAAKVDPVETRTDADGNATVLYPELRDVEEQIRTISVSLSVDHPDYAYSSDLHIDVPLETKGPYEIRLAAGTPVDLRITSDGNAADLDGVFVMWSDGRSWQPGVAPRKLDNGLLRIPAMPPGDNTLLVVKLAGQRATHFSKLTEFKLTPGEPKTLEVALQPSLQVKGVLSSNVPRPVREGRVKVDTLDPADAPEGRVSWFTWAPIEADGTFTIDGWPAEEAMQLIALCDGYMAESGRAPEGVKNAPDPKADPFSRPQVFHPAAGGTIEVAMAPLVKCDVTTLDEDEKPVAGVAVVSWPNVGWWNKGSQIYCDPLVRCEQLVKERSYQNAIDKVYPPVFRITTDGNGQANMQLPPGREFLAIDNDVYEMPVFLGSRDQRVMLTRGETSKQTLRLQPRGTEKLGEWDKLAGVVFGCSTREGRRICALPGVRKKMDEFEVRFRLAKNQRDPQLLSEAYTAVADAFVGVGDQEEAAKWRAKAQEQADKVKK